MTMLTEIRRKLPLMKPQTEDTATPETAQAVLELAIETIIPNRNQPRSTFNQNAIQRLADSIRRYGILQPLTVRKVLLPSSPSHPERNQAVYELVAGERRLRAAKLADLTTVPCIVINTDDATSAELAIVENLLRENLNMFEQAEAFERLIREFHLTQDEAARRVSMSQSAVANKLRILRLLPEERQKILQSGLSERHARALLKLTEPTLRGEVLDRIIDQKMNVSATEAYIDRLLTDIARFQTAEEAKKASQPEHSVELPPVDAIKPSEPPTTLVARPRPKVRINDLQVFYNSIQNAVNILKTLGINGTIDKREHDDEVTVTIALTRAEH
ncbi:MAG: ParB/RepB/Spo0J family partition protein [Clostridia bacterium]|nr:ParB/RepB/Spo0J family partition protein [Clostridia bacterium]